MNISEETRAQVIREHRREIAKRAAATLRKRRGADYFKTLGSHGGTTLKNRKGVSYLKRLAKKGGLKAAENRAA